LTAQVGLYKRGKRKYRLATNPAVTPTQPSTRGERSWGKKKFGKQADVVSHHGKGEKDWNGAAGTDTPPVPGTSKGGAKKRNMVLKGFQRRI